MASGAQVRQLSEWYTFRDRGAVLTFLDRNPAVVEALLSIHGQLMHFFPGAQIFLQIVHDHEIPYHDKLVAFIGIPTATRDSAQDAVRTLLEFVVQWRQTVPSVVQQRLGLNLELQSSESAVKRDDSHFLSGV